MAQTAKNLPVMQETHVPTLGLGNRLGEGNGNPFQYSCLENPWTEEPGRLQFMGCKKSDTIEHLTMHTHLS